MSPHIAKVYFDIALSIVLLLGALGFWKFLWPAVARFGGRIGDVFRAIGQMPEINDKLNIIAHEVLPNGNSSMKDSLGRLEIAVVDLKNRQVTMEATARVRADTDPLTCHFERSADGKNIYSSETYTRLLKTGGQNLLGWGYMSFVHKADLREMAAEWDDCRAKRRAFRGRYRMIASDGEVIPVDVSVRPVPEDGEVQKWIGVLRRVVDP